jgi:hypothetical protein
MVESILSDDVSTIIMDAWSTRPVSFLSLIVFLFCSKNCYLRSIFYENDEMEEELKATILLIKINHYSYHLSKGLLLLMQSVCIVITDGGLVT